MRKRIISLSFLACSYLGASAQWATVPSENLSWKSVASKLTYPGELVIDQQTGFTYATMERNERLPGDAEDDSSLPVYLQIFDPQGIPVLKDGGLMVTEIQSKSYSTGYALLTADNGDALLAYTDVRHNGSAEIYLYRVTKKGEHLWFDSEGNPGKRLTENEAQEMRLKMVKFDTDKYVVAWTESGTTKFTIVDQDGENLEKYPVELAPGAMAPVLLATEDNGFIIGYSQAIENEKHQLMVAKYNTRLECEWKQPFALSGVSAVTRYNMISDGNNGVVLAWSWGVNLGEAFVSIQHIKADGTKVIPDNQLTDSNSNFQHDYPVLAYDQANDEIAVAWRKRRKTPLPTLWDKMVVRRYKAGVAVGGTTDAEIKLFEDGATYSHWPVSLKLIEGGDVILTYQKSVSSGKTDEIICRRFNRSLQQVWMKLINGKPTSKSMTRETPSYKDQFVMQWMEEDDEINTSMRIQNINHDGELGLAMVTSLDNQIELSGITVAPTVVADQLKVTCDLTKEEQVSISMYNLFGTAQGTLYTGKLAAGSNEMSFSLFDYQSGVYLIEVKVGNKRHTQRIIVK
ncbi:MAG: T9SS type A sorting domain-containing protein [Bacteroidales bacterium]